MEAKRIHDAAVPDGAAVFRAHRSAFRARSVDSWEYL